MRTAPEPLPFGAEFHGPQVMQVPALAVQDLPEHALADHVEHHHLHAPVGAVLHHDAVLAVLLRVLDQVPAVLDRVGRRHLSGGVLAVAHRREANRDVPLPRRGVVDQIQVLLLAHAHEVPRTPGVARRAGISGGGDQVLHARDLFRHNVAHGLEDAALDPNQVAHMGTPHPADADEADPDRVHRRGGEEPLGRGSRLGPRPGRRSAHRGSAGCGPAQGGQPEPASNELQRVPPVQVIAFPGHVNLPLGRAPLDAVSETCRQARLGARERVILSAVGAKDLLVTRRGRRAVSLGVPGGAMRQTSQREQAETFRRLHREGGILVLPNAWDVITARVIESAGFAAIATSSAGVAWALGYADGARISRGETPAGVRPIASTGAVPVPAGMDAGCGRTPEAAAETARGVIAAGAIGLNLEDATDEGPLLDLTLQVERVRAVREAGAAARVPLVVNARTDAFEVKHWSPAERFTAAVRRANAYRAAGADCVLVPHVSDAETIGRLAREIAGPLNVIAGPPAPPLGQLESLGVRRASLGPRIVQATLGLIRRITAELRERGTYEALADLVIPFAEIQRLIDR